MVQEPRVRDAMQADVHGISEESSLYAAAKAMVEKGINSLVVWPIREEEPYGILTSTDLVNAIAIGTELEEKRVADFRTTPLVMVTPGVRLRDAARLMARQNLRHLVVFNGRQVVGILSNFDLLKAAVKSPKALSRKPTEILTA